MNDSVIITTTASLRLCVIRVMIEPAEGKDTVMSEELRIRPYARLLTMLGDQLIDNEATALLELVKNAYDADATWVKISLNGFNADMTANKNSSITIQDNGTGMTSEIIRNHWLNPATPIKLQRKQDQPLTQKGRHIQGEKGIGRFAVFKLGGTVRITTRRQATGHDGRFIEGGAPVEDTLTCDYAKYGADFIDNGRRMFLDDLKATLKHDAPRSYSGNSIQLGLNDGMTTGQHGTIIEVTGLHGQWGMDRVEKVRDELDSMESSIDNDQGFRVYVYADGRWLHGGGTSGRQKLDSLTDGKAVLKAESGRFSQADQSFSFMLDGRKTVIRLDDPEVRGLTICRHHHDGAPTCGDFGFDLYLFDDGADGEPDVRHRLDSEDKTLLEHHRVYLYRDGIRVMPYGSPDNDWLGLDSGGQTPRNSQTLGRLYLTQSGNPGLRDKTSREGLIEGDPAFESFRYCVRVLLSWLMAGPYSRYAASKRERVESNSTHGVKLNDLIAEARDKAGGDPGLVRLIDSISDGVQAEEAAAGQRVRKTEDLAAVGLSVETASHDMMKMLRQSVNQLDAIIRSTSDDSPVDTAGLLGMLDSTRGQLSMVESQMASIQFLFPSSKGAPKDIDVMDAIDRVHGVYSTALDHSGVRVDYRKVGGPLRVRATDATLLQVFINLFDNALWWLQTVDHDRRILITVDGGADRVVFSDNGPGVKPKDAPYICRPFYSGRGNAGRGLGLYIATQLLDRFGYTIRLADARADRVLDGANFIIDFNGRTGAEWNHPLPA